MLHLFIAWNNAKCTDLLSICALESSVDFSISWNWSCCKKCIFGKKHRVHVLVPCTIQLSIGAKKTIDSPVCKKETQIIMRIIVSANIKKRTRQEYTCSTTQFALIWNICLFAFVVYFNNFRCRFASSFENCAASLPLSLHHRHETTLVGANKVFHIANFHPICERKKTTTSE